ncbi:MAG: CDP-glycerol glycerophosphotransferase family protein [Actinobacteria bacterium]|nr:CDP-glycerol glycerophosphotransferase family protein [Actinomycetota bacterium]
MSDDELAEVEENSIDENAAQNASAAQAVRMGNSFEFARAVVGPRYTPGWLGWVDAFAARAYLPVTIAAWLGVVVCILAGWVLPGIVLVALSGLFDWAASRQYVRETLLLRRLGFPPHVRLGIRAVLLLALLASRGWGTAAVGFAAVALSLILLEGVQWAATAWLASRQPALSYHPEGPQPPASVAYARAYGKSSFQATESVVVEVLAELAVAAMVLGVLGGRYAVVLWATLLGLAALAFVARHVLRVRALGSPAAVTALQRSVQDELDAFGPRAVIYMSADAGQSLYILNQWVPALEQLPHPAFIMVREASHLAPIMPTSLPVLYAPSTRHVEELCRPSLLVAYYLANAGKNVHLLREARIRHVFLNHGDSDKSTSANPVARVYDGVWVAGQAAIDRYEAAGISMPRSQYAIIGRPQVEGLRVGTSGNADPVTILYAPTFEGYYEESNYSSLERMGPAMIRQILETHPEVRIIFKPHPASGVQRPGMIQARIEIVAMLAEAPGDHLYVGPDSSLTLYECFDSAHVLISDISSVVTDFLYSERPLITSNPRRLDRETFLRTFPTQGASYIVERDLSNLAALLDDALGDDSLREQRQAMKKYVLGDLPEGPTAAFVAEAARTAAEAEQHAASIVNEFRVKV